MSLVWELFFFLVEDFATLRPLGLSVLTLCNHKILQVIKLTWLAICNYLFFLLSVNLISWNVLLLSTATEFSAVMLCQFLQLGMLARPKKSCQNGFFMLETYFHVAKLIFLDMSVGFKNETLNLSATPLFWPWPLCTGSLSINDLLQILHQSWPWNICRANQCPPPCSLLLSPWTQWEVHRSPKFLVSAWLASIHTQTQCRVALVHWLVLLLHLDPLHWDPGSEDGLLQPLPSTASTHSDFQSHPWICNGEPQSPHISCGSLGPGSAAHQLYMTVTSQDPQCWAPAPLPGSAVVSPWPLSRSTAVSPCPLPGSTVVSPCPLPGSTVVSLWPLSGSTVVSPCPLPQTAPSLPHPYPWIPSGDPLSSPWICCGEPRPLPQTASILLHPLTPGSAVMSPCPLLHVSCRSPITLSAHWTQ